MYFQQTKSGPKATKKPFTAGKAKASVRKSLFSSHIRDEKALNKRGNYLKGGKEGRPLRLALTTAAKPKRPRWEPSHTHELTRGATTGARRGQEKVAGCRRGSSPVWGVLSHPPAQHITPLQPTSLYSPKDATQPPNYVPGSTEAIGCSNKKKKSKYFKEPHRLQLSLRGSQSFHVHAKNLWLSSFT